MKNTDRNFKAICGIVVFREKCSSRKNEINTQRKKKNVFDNYAAVEISNQQIR